MFHLRPISNYTLILLEVFYEMTADGPWNGLVGIKEDNFEILQYPRI